MAFNSTQNMMALIMAKNGFGNLGFYSLGVLYFSWGMGSMISTAVMNRLGFRMCMVMGGLGNCIWIYGSILPVIRAEYPNSTNFFLSYSFIYPFIIMISSLNGAMNGPMWVSTTKYIVDCAGP